MNEIELKSICVQNITNIGNNTYQNICTGEKVIVSWGIPEWFFFIFFVGAIIVIGYCFYQMLKLLKHL